MFTSTVYLYHYTESTLMNEFSIMFFLNFKKITLDCFYWNTVIFLPIQYMYFFSLLNCSRTIKAVLKSFLAYSTNWFTGFWKKLAPDIIQQILLVLVSLAGDETSSESCNENQSFLPFIFSEGKSGETGVISRRNGCSIPFDSDRGSFSYFFMKPQLFMSPDLIQPAYFPQQQQQRQLSRRITDISFNTSVKEYVPVSSSHTAHDNKNSNTTLLIAKQRGLSASKDMDYSGSIVPQKPMDKPSLIQDALFAMLDTASLTFPRNPSTGYLCLRPRKHWIPGAPKALLMRFVKAARLVNELKVDSFYVRHCVDYSSMNCQCLHNHSAKFFYYFS